MTSDIHHLGPSDVHAWCRATRMLAGPDEADLEVLSNDERLRLGRFIHAEDRRDFAAAHAMVRRALSRYDGRSPAAWRFLVERSGKPYLAPDTVGAAFTTNLSHTRGFVAAVVGRTARVGVDVQAIDTAVDWSTVAQRFFTSDEVADLVNMASEEQAIRFVETWTLKEAWFKANGQGIGEGLDRIGIRLGENGCITAQVRSPYEGRQWTLGLFAPVPTIRMAVCAEGAVNVAAWLLDGTRVASVQHLRRSVITRSSSVR